MPNRKANIRQRMALIIAQVVRDNMEDFHVAHLTDAQMKELNRLIRDAIYTAFVAMADGKRDAAASQWLSLMERMVPNYWENPKLMPSYKETKRFIKKHGQSPKLLLPES